MFTINFGGFFAGEHLHPGDFPFACVGLGDGGIQHFYARAPNIGTGSIPFNKGDDGLVWNI
jgi:hypothetical protein